MSNILITGGTGVVGFELVRSMVKDGHKVFFTTRSISKGEILIKEEKLDPKCVKIIEVDFFSNNCLNVMAKQIKDNIETIIFNARSIDNLKIDKKGQISAEQFQKELYMAVTLPYLLTNFLLEHGNQLRDIIFISSIYGIVGPSPSLYENFTQQSPINYGVGKAAQIHLTKELAIRLAIQKIRVNCISYGGIEGRANKEFKQKYAEKTPLHRMLTKADIFPPIQFILNNLDLAITGENIKIDGGWTIW